MNASSSSLVTRVSRVWVARYTAGLPGTFGTERRAEVDSDLAEHAESRREDDWTGAAITREQLWRLARGAPADLAWRGDVLAPTYRSTATVRGAVLATSTVGSLLIVAFQVLFATYVLGTESLADEHYVLGGMDYYSDNVGTNPIFAGVLISVATVLAAACIARPFAPFASNLAAIAVAAWLLMWFWLRMWPLAIIVIATSLLDMSLRAPEFIPRE